MTERLLCGWGAFVIVPCGCNGKGIKPNDTVCTCEAGKRLRDQPLAQGERKVLCNGVLPDPDQMVYGPGPSIHDNTRYG